MPTAGLDTTLLFLLNRYGPTMTLEELRDVFVRGVTLKTMQNRACAGRLPRRTGLVFDTRDVVAWWDDQREQHKRRA